MATWVVYLSAINSTDVILRMLPINARGMDEKNITAFILFDPSRIYAKTAATAINEMTDLRPLHGRPTSNEPAGM